MTPSPSGDGWHWMTVRVPGEGHRLARVRVVDGFIVGAMMRFVSARLVPFAYLTHWVEGVGSWTERA